MLSNEASLVERVLEHIAEIGAGKCSITDAGIAAEADPSVQQILAGLLMLHEDLQYAQQRQSALLDELRARGARARRVPLRRVARAADADHDAGAADRRPVARAARAGVRAADAKRWRTGCELTRRQVDRLAALVSTLVDVSRITSGKAGAVEAARRPGRRHQDGGRTSRRRCPAQRLVAAASRASGRGLGRLRRLACRPGAHQPGVQRDPLRTRPADHDRRRRQARQRALLGRRSRHRNSARAPDPHLPAVRTGRAVDQLRRPGAGAVDLAADRRRHGRERSPSAAQVDVGSVFTVELPRDA